MLVLIILTTNFAFSQTPSILDLKIASKENLSKWPVIGIVQDSSGYIWWATENTVNRYNGKSEDSYTRRLDILRIEQNPWGGKIKSIHTTSYNGILIQYEKDLTGFTFLENDNKEPSYISLNKERGIEGEVVQIKTDAVGEIYVLARLGEKYILYKSTEKLMFEHVFFIDVDESEIIDFIITRKKEFWLMRQHFRIERLSLVGELIEEILVRKKYWNKQKGFVPDIFYEDQYQRIWLSFKGKTGLLTYDTNGKEFKPINPLFESRSFSKLWEDLQGNIILGVSKEARIMDELYFWNEDNEVKNISSLSEDFRTANVIHSQDFSEVIFVGAFETGLTKFVLKNAAIKNYLSVEQEEGSWELSVRSITQAKDGSIYFARDVDYWFHLYPENNRIDTIPIPGGITHPDTNYMSSFNLLYDQSGYLWGTKWNKDDQQYLLLKYDIAADSFKIFPMPHHSIQFMAFSSDSLIWFTCGKEGKRGGLYSFDRQTDSFTLYNNIDGINPFENHTPLFFLEGSNGIFWVGTTNGLFRIDRSQKTSKKIIKAENQAFSNNHVYVIHQDSMGKLLIGTAGGGLQIYDPESEYLEIYRQANGLSSDYVGGILPDANGNYWLSTFDGLSYFDIRNQSFRNFYKSDGLSDDEFNRFSFFKDRKGYFYFGGMNGLNVFRTEDFLKVKSIPALCLSKYSYYDPSLKKPEVDSTMNLKNLQSVKIAPSVSRFQFEFFLPDYKSPNKNRYRSKLIGRDEKWNDLGFNNSVYFDHLPAGNYQLHIQGAAAGGDWENQGLIINIEVEEYFYKTPLAYFLYALPLLALFYMAYKTRVKRKLELAEAKRLKELDEFKSRFYTNISHEFRTPLTLILGPIENAIAHFDKRQKEDLLTDLKLIGRSGKRMLYLINRILDLSKLEAGNLEPEYRLANVVDYLKYLTDSFHSLAQTKNIQLTFYSEVNNPELDFDYQKLTHIIYNLLSNAIKFTPDSGKVILHVRELEEQLIIKVIDNGVGIPPASLSHIFDRFHSASNQDDNIKGTGIGLAFTKELVNLFEGKIKAENNLEKGATFQVIFPISRQAPKLDKEHWTAQMHEVTELQTNISTKKTEHPVILSKNQDLPFILIIEDHYEVANYIRHCLKSDYQLEIAPNGKVGVERALVAIPDLVISDVMMPEKDGLEVCLELKNDTKTSHIPVILLTAKADLEARLEGLSKGADDYLSKPFNERELKMRIENLLNSRRKLQEYYRSSLLVDTDLFPSNNLKEEVSTLLDSEKTFLLDVRKIIEQHFNDSGFDISKLCKSIGISRAQLHRKLKALTGQSTTNFINSIKIAKAQDLLNQTELNISEIAYEVGFSDPNYFSRTFVKLIGCNPTEFRDKVEK